jgi:acid phosphatase
MVRPGRYSDPITHYRVLRTIEDLYGLPHAGHAADVPPIAGIWLRPK